MLLKLAWRNIFRNKKRSIISISSVVFAVLFAVFMRSLQFGAYDNMLKNIVGNYLGYIQIQNKYFQDERTIDNSFLLSDIEGLAEQEEIQYYLPRIESFVLASHNDISKPAALLGLDPEKEAEYINLSNRVIAGEYLSASNVGLLVAKDLKEILGVELGDSLVLLGQGYQGSIAATTLPVLGVVDLITPDLNKRTLVVNFSEAQLLFGLENMATTAVIGVENGDWESAQSRVQSSIDTTQLAALNWKQMVPELDQIITVDKAGGTFTLMILYLIIAFGLFGTVLMLTQERMFEYGILISIGMQKAKIIKTFLLETLLMALAGVVIGLVVAFPIVAYFHFNPINLAGQMQEVVEQFGFEPLIPTSIDPAIAFTHSFVILLITLLVSLYAVVKIRNLEPIKAMRK